MRYFLLLSFFLGFHTIQAQQSLSFSQNLLIDNIEDTVPANKVWKVVSILYSNPVANIQGGNQNDNVVVDGTNLTVRSSRSSNGGYNAVTWGVWEQSLPIWLPAGTRLRTGTNVYRISVLEFDVVP